MTTRKFADWIRDELTLRHWTPAELSRQSGLSTSQITRILNNERGTGEKGLVALAKAFSYPIDVVFEKAGLVSPKPSLSPIKRKLMHVIESEDLAESDIELAITLLEQRIDLYKRNPKAKPAHPWGHIPKDAVFHSISRSTEEGAKKEPDQLIRLFAFYHFPRGSTHPLVRIVFVAPVPLERRRT